jgi:hypothetical protein
MAGSPMAINASWAWGPRWRSFERADELAKAA